mmetsp:Transcript_12928/g.26197  ORF Transcript_12928/g.26197 Transcript_12928/m.26197 type:complete len:363 (+) Transcript_12928:801-1889(+)
MRMGCHRALEPRCPGHSHRPRRHVLGRRRWRVRLVHGQHQPLLPSPPLGLRPGHERWAWQPRRLPVPALPRQRADGLRPRVDGARRLLGPAGRLVPLPSVPRRLAGRLPVDEQHAQVGPRRARQLLHNVGPLRLAPGPRVHRLPGRRRHHLRHAHSDQARAGDPAHHCHHHRGLPCRAHLHLVPVHARRQARPQEAGRHFQGQALLVDDLPLHHDLRQLHRLLVRLPQADHRPLRRVRLGGLRAPSGAGSHRSGLQGGWRLLVHRLAGQGLLARLPWRPNRLAHPPARWPLFRQVWWRACHPLPHPADDHRDGLPRHHREVCARGDQGSHGLLPAVLHLLPGPLLRHRRRQRLDLPPDRRHL